MKLYTLQRQQIIPVSIGEAWDFFSNPCNLPLITPAWMNFRITSEVPEKMYAGMIIAYRVRPLLNFPLDWITEITHVDEPRMFVDEQRFGPYRFWHHQHIFRETERGVEMRDIVHYALRGGIFGRAINELIVQRKLREIFDHRVCAVEQIFASAAR